VVELSNSDFTSGLRRLLGAEIVKRPLMTSQETPVTSERYTVDSKHVLNTNRKSWSTNQLVASFPVCAVI
jgi:secreted Zn-dependent insulinase-like peptidase